MAYAIQLTDASASVTDTQTTLRQLESQDYTVVSFAAAAISGNGSNVVTLDRATTTSTVSVRVIDGTLSRAQQRAALNAAVGSGTLVSYARAWINGALANVAVIRAA